jgi:glycosyltransferase involved in cell wall biosynthesis
MLEAMACGLPIITTPCEGIEELIRDNGIIIREETANGIAQAIATLAADSRKMTSMSAAARKHSENFTWQAISQDYLNFYKKILI